jgi:hypothetical protein
VGVAFFQCNACPRMFVGAERGLIDEQFDGG